jgi:hypothetical protein
MPPLLSRNNAVHPPCVGVAADAVTGKKYLGSELFSLVLCVDSGWR